MGVEAGNLLRRLLETLEGTFSGVTELSLRPMAFAGLA